MDDINGSAASSTITTGYASATNGQQSSATSAMHATDASTTNTASQSVVNPSYPTSYADPYWTGSKRKREASSVGSPGNFPRLVKMVEKRKPHSNIQPYCQKMQVLNNYQIMPIPTVPTICIEENEYDPAAATQGGSKRRAVHKRSPDTMTQLGSNCICEWFSDY